MDEKLRKIIEVIFTTHEEGEMDCPTCHENLHRLWSLVENGAEISEIVPALAAHLACCPECKEEYDAFTCIMRAEQQGLTSPPEA
ncbi:MAG: hypothetical protein IAE89_04935 [Anaerolineae bacterium]|nr:hypothetical protein [Anaerolineae bacterium]